MAEKLEEKQLKSPVPPWNKKNIRKLAKFLGLPFSEIAKRMGVSKEAIFAWLNKQNVKFRKQTIEKQNQFEHEIPKLRKLFEEKESKEKIEKEEKSFVENYSFKRISPIVSEMGFSIIELATLCQISYDSMISWYVGRRKCKRIWAIRVIENILENEKMFTKNLPFQSGQSNLWCEMVFVTNHKFSIYKIAEHDCTVRKGEKHDFLLFQSRKDGELKGIISLNSRKIPFQGFYNQLKKRGEAISTVFIIPREGEDNIENTFTGAIVFHKKHGSIVFINQNNFPYRVWFNNENA